MLYNLAHQADWELVENYFPSIVIQGKMELYSIIFGALLVLIVPQTVRADIPGCHFLETVNLSSSHRLHMGSYGSYLYKDLVVPVHLTGEYDYITAEWGINNTVKRHLRGCVCQLYLVLLPLQRLGNGQWRMHRWPDGGAVCD